MKKILTQKALVECRTTFMIFNKEDWTMYLCTEKFQKIGTITPLKSEHVFICQ